MYCGTPIKLPADFFSRNFAGRKGVARYIQSAERKKNTSNQKYITQQSYSELKLR